MTDEPNDVDRALWHMHQARKVLPDDEVSVGVVYDLVDAVMNEIADRFDVLPAEAVYRVHESREDHQDVESKDRFEEISEMASQVFTDERRAEKQKLRGLEDAAQRVWNVLGPEPTDCCDGCRTEMQDALDAVEPFIENLYEE